jgi:hypothetical protein
MANTAEDTYDKHMWLAHVTNTHDKHTGQKYVENAYSKHLWQIRRQTHVTDTHDKYTRDKHMSQKHLKNTRVQEIWFFQFTVGQNDDNSTGVNTEIQGKGKA